MKGLGWFAGKGPIAAVFITFLLIASFPTEIGATTNVGPIVVSTDSPDYDLGELVTIIASNEGTDPIEGTPACSIYDEYGNAVKTYYFTQVLEIWEPGQVMNFTWDQTDDMGNPVMPGQYKVWISFGGYEDTAYFNILDDNTGFVHVLHPNGGEVFHGNVDIDWEFAAPDCDLIGIGWQFDLFYSPALDMPTQEYPANSWIYIDTLHYNPSANPDTQEYPAPHLWDTTNLTEGDYAVRVVGYYGNCSLEDTGDGTFLISRSDRTVWIEEFNLGDMNRTYHAGDVLTPFALVERGSDMLTTVWEGTLVLEITFDDIDPVEYLEILRTDYYDVRLSSGGSMQEVIFPELELTEPGAYNFDLMLYEGLVDGGNQDYAGAVDEEHLMIFVEEGPEHPDAWIDYAGTNGYEFSIGEKIIADAVVTRGPDDLAVVWEGHMAMDVYGIYYAQDGNIVEDETTNAHHQEIPIELASGGESVTVRFDPFTLDMEGDYIIEFNLYSIHGDHMDQWEARIYVYGEEPNPKPRIWIETFESDKDSYNLGDQGNLLVTIARDSDDDNAGYEGVCVVYYGPADENYIEEYYTIKYSLPGPNSTASITVDLAITEPSDYYAVAELYDTEYYYIYDNTTTKPTRCCPAPFDSEKLYLPVEESDWGVKVFNPREGDVVSGDVKIAWETLTEDGETREGTADILLVPMYYDDVWMEPLAGYESSDPTYDGDGNGIPDEKEKDENYDQSGSTDNTTDTDSDGIPDYEDPYPEDPANIAPPGEKPIIEDTYVIAKGIENTGKYLWNSSEVENFAYRIVVKVHLDDGLVMKGDSGTFFVMNGVIMEEPDAYMFLFYTDRAEYEVGEEVQSTAIVARNNWDETPVEGFVTFTVSNQFGEMLYENEKYFYIAPTGEFATVIFEPFMLEEPGVYWFTASLGDEIFYPKPMPVPVEEEVYYEEEKVVYDDGTTSYDSGDYEEGSPGGSYDEDGAYPGDPDSSYDDGYYYEDPYYKPDYMNWYGPQIITIPVICWEDGQGEWTVELERPVDGDVMHRLDHIMWTFNGPYSFDFGDQYLEDWDADVPPEWYDDGGYYDGDEEGVEPTPEPKRARSEPTSDGGAVESSSEETPYPDDNYVEGEPGIDYSGMDYGMGNLFVRIEYRALKEELIEDDPDASYEKVGWKFLAEVNAHHHILPWKTYDLPNGNHEMRISLFQYNYDFEEMGRNTTVVSGGMPCDYVMGEKVLAEDFAVFSVYNDYKNPDDAESWSEIEAAYKAGYILGEAFAFDAEDKPMSYGSGVDISLEYGNGFVDITVSAESDTGKILVVNIDPSKLDIQELEDVNALLEAIEVMFDENAIEHASLDQVLNAPVNDLEEAVFSALITASSGEEGRYNIKLFVYIPHFSTHTIRVKKTSGTGESPVPIGTDSFNPIWYLGFGIAVGAVIATSGALLYARTKEQKKEEKLAKELAVVERETEEDDKWERML